MKKPYRCAICGREGIKLWRPYLDSEPLVCAKCAEERQAPRLSEEVEWRKEGREDVAHLTGKYYLLPPWSVDEKGKIPSRYRFLSLTDILCVDLNGVSSIYTSGETDMIPAIPDEEGYFWGYTSRPEEKCKWWENLPTK